MFNPDLVYLEGIEPHWDYIPGKGKNKIKIDPDSGRSLIRDVSIEQINHSTPDVGTWTKVGLCVAGVAIIVIDIVTVPTGKGSIVIELISKALGTN